MPKVASKDGTPIAFDRSGTGPALILVDGALCSRSFGPMPKLVPHLSSRFTVFTYDRRGRGGSGDTRPYAPAREIEDLDALIKEAGGSAFVFGLSSGAALALEAAAGVSSIAKLALYEPPFIADESAGAAPDHRARLAGLIAANRRGDAVKYFMRDMVQMPAIAVFIMRLLVPLWSKIKAVAHTLPYDAAILGDFTLPRQRAAAVRVPTIAIDGEKSDPRLRKAAQAVARAIPNAEHRTLKGQTHNVDGKAVAPVLTEFFLAEQRGRG
jgi:pimeloyl-ACP methyl ester carboxylesterase